MTDLREYKANVLEAVKAVREADENWSWRVAAVNKSSVRVRWGYFDYLEEKEDITITVSEDEYEDDELVAVRVDIPDGTKRYYFVGSKHWDDAKDIGTAVKMAVFGAAAHCHSVY